MALNKKNILNKKTDLDLVFKKGKTRKGNFLYLKYLENNLGYSKFVIIIPSKIIKKATERSSIKRLISEFVRTNLVKDPVGNNFLIIINKKTDEVNYVNDLIKIIKNEKNSN